ncbi:MAG: MerC domain-containing protein, partial [Bacteroidota bacterium]
GIFTSIVCIIHCLSIPLFLVFGFDALLRMVDQEWIEMAIIIVALIIGLSSFLMGFLKHRQHFVPVLFISGFLLIVNGESVDGEALSLVLSITGAMVIIYAHVQNLRLRRYLKSAE